MADTRAVSDVLSHGHLFGLKTDVKSNVHYVEEHMVAYPCGHSVVFLHLETHAQQVSSWLTLCFIPGMLQYIQNRPMLCRIMQVYVRRFSPRHQDEARVPHLSYKHTTRY